MAVESSSRRGVSAKSTPGGFPKCPVCHYSHTRCAHDAGGDASHDAGRNWCALMTNESESPDVTPIAGSLAGVKFLTVAEVASVMRVSKMSVYRMIHSGELEAARFGRSFRVPEKAVHDYLRGSYFETG